MLPWWRPGEPCSIFTAESVPTVRPELTYNKLCLCSELRQVVVPQALEDLDQILQPEHVAPVRAIVYRRIAAEPLTGRVGKVDHTNVHQGRLLGHGMRWEGN